MSDLRPNLRAGLRPELFRSGPPHLGGAFPFLVLILDRKKRTAAETGPYLRSSGFPFSDFPLFQFPDFPFRLLELLLEGRELLLQLRDFAAEVGGFLLQFCDALVFHAHRGRRRFEGQRFRGGDGVDRAGE